MVIETSTDLLQQHTKDIRLLTWLIEGWANLAGFEGIAKGVELSHLLLDRYWDSIHPVIEDQDLDQRLGLLQGLINQLPMLVKSTSDQYSTSLCIAAIRKFSLPSEYS